MIVSASTLPARAQLSDPDVQKLLNGDASYKATLDGWTDELMRDRKGVLDAAKFVQALRNTPDLASKDKKDWTNLASARTSIAARLADIDALRSKVDAALKEGPDADASAVLNDRKTWLERMDSNAKKLLGLTNETEKQAESLVASPPRPADAPAAADGARAGSKPADAALGSLPKASAPAKPRAPIDKILAQMTPQQKVREIMMAEAPYGEKTPYAGVEIRYGDDFKKLAAQAKGDGTTPRFTPNSQRVGNYLIKSMEGTDQEGGKVEMFHHLGYPTQPSARELAELHRDGKDAEIRKIGAETAQRAYDHGIHMIYGPDLDRQSREEGDPSLYSKWVKRGGKPLSLARYDSTQEQSRRVSDDPHEIVEVERLYLRGAKDRIQAIETETGRPAALYFTGKHFPGEGGTPGVRPVDSDDAQIVDRASLDELRRRAAIYRPLAQEGLIDGAMISNNVYAGANPRRPGILAPELRGLVPDGLFTTTDDIALARRQQSQANELPGFMTQAFKAGNDFLMVCDAGQCRNTLESTFARSIYSDPSDPTAAPSDPALARRLDDSVRKMLILKDKAGLIVPADQ